MITIFSHTPLLQEPAVSAVTAGDVLKATISAGLGAEADPRPGQRLLCEAVAETMASIDPGNYNPHHLAGVAKTGTGKTFAYLAAAAQRAATQNQRTVVATESLNLQRQIVEHDATQINAGLRACRLREATFRVLKGSGNYIDPRRCMLSMCAIVDALATTGARSHRKELLDISKSIDAVAAELVDPARTETTITAEHIHHITSTAADLLTKADELLPAGSPATIDLGQHTFDRRKLIAAALWAARTGCQPSSPVTDIDDYRAETEAGLWSHFTIPATDARPSSSTAESRPAARARDEAARADIVITNHALLAIQAAKDVPAVISNRRLGTFDHLVIDEAHSMPAAVRSHGSAAVSARTIRALLRSLRTNEKSIDSAETYARLLHDGDGLAQMVTEALMAAAGSPRTAQEVRIDAEADPTADFAPAATAWLKRLRAEVKAAGRRLSAAGVTPENVSRIDSLARLYDRAGALMDTIDDCAAHRTGQARWIAVERNSHTGALEAELAVSVIDVARLLRQRLYTGYRQPDAQLSGGPTANVDWLTSGSDDSADDASDTHAPHWRSGESYPLSVTCVSATLGHTFSTDMGLSVTVESFPTSFDAAYAASAAFSPSARSLDGYLEPSEVAVKSGGRWRFDRDKHTQWCAHAALRLVTANGGRALILTSAKRPGEELAAYLRTHLPAGITVYDQWSGLSKTTLLDAFTRDETSVMVGTRGWMTGINVPGETCSLVIIDRVPRAPRNAVDDARAELLAGSANVSFTDTEAIYGADAAVLLEQAFGRLLRRASDTGMVALLDPRIAKTSKLSNRGPARAYYAELIKEYGHRISTLDTACRWLAERRTAVQ